MVASPSIRRVARAFQGAISAALVSVSLAPVSPAMASSASDVRDLLLPDSRGVPTRVDAGTPVGLDTPLTLDTPVVRARTAVLDV
jgi:hypothetical protein